MGWGVGWPQWSTRCQLVSARGSPRCPRGPDSRGNTLFLTKEKTPHTRARAQAHPMASVYFHPHYIRGVSSFDPETGSWQQVLLLGNRNDCFLIFLSRATQKCSDAWSGKVKHYEIIYDRQQPVCYLMKCPVPHPLSSANPSSRPYVRFFRVDDKIIMLR